MEKRHGGVETDGREGQEKTGKATKMGVHTVSQQPAGVFSRWLLTDLGKWWLQAI